MMYWCQEEQINPANVTKNEIRKNKTKQNSVGLKGRLKLIFNEKKKESKNTWDKPAHWRYELLKIDTPFDISNI